MHEELIQILWGALLIAVVVISSLAPLVKKIKEAKKKGLRPVMTARNTQQTEYPGEASEFQETVKRAQNRPPKPAGTQKQTGTIQSTQEEQPHRPGIAEEFDLRKAVLYSEILTPKFKEE